MNDEFIITKFYVPCQFHPMILIDHKFYDERKYCIEFYMTNE